MSLLRALIAPRLSQWRHFHSRSALQITSNGFDHLGQPHPRSHPHLLKQGEVTPGISLSEYLIRRQALVNQLPENSIVVIPGNPAAYMANDIRFPFHQQNDFFYLTGFMEPSSTLVLEIPAQGLKVGIGKPKKFTASLFVPPRDITHEMWDGPITGVERVQENFGLDMAHDHGHLSQFLSSAKDRYKHHYLTQPDKSARPMQDQILGALGLTFNDVKNVTPNLHNQRQIKSPAEVALMRKACQITARSFKHIMKNVKCLGDAVSEHVIHAEFQASALYQGAKILAYPPVVAGGARANTLHYVSNDMMVQRNELVLVDAGAEYHGYCGDITRTYPVSGKFSQPQRELYEVVLQTNERCLQRLAERSATDRLSLNDLHEFSVQVMQEGLEKLSIDPKLVRGQLYPHHVGHFLGLDVHDTATSSKYHPLREGMVITVEPGIYVPHDNRFPKRFQGIGIRVEDDVLLTPEGAEILTSEAPKTVREIEAIMAS